MAEKKYEDFLTLTKEIRHLTHIQSILHWDMSCHMPRRAAENRGSQIAVIARLTHDKRCAAKYRELIADLSDSPDLSADQKVNVHEAGRDVWRATRISNAFVSKLAEAETETHAKWLEARAANDFGVVEPAFTELVELKKEYGRALGDGGNIYDALLDQYEPGLTQKVLDEFFLAVCPAAKNLLDKVLDSSDGLERRCLEGKKFAISAQRELFAQAVLAIGFDLTLGRIDETVHPFCCELGPRDIRLAVRCVEGDFLDGFMGAVHEAGHGIYDQGLSKINALTPLGEARCLSIHESQSLLWEKRVCRGYEFWQYYYPLVQKRFPESLGSCSLDEFYRAVNQVRPGLIRFNSDEVCYSLHIAVRYYLERDLIEGRLLVADLRDAWIEKYQAILGIKPPDDLKGVLQDVQWYLGEFGYFPVYALGASYAAELFSAFAVENLSWREEFQ